MDDYQLIAVEEVRTYALRVILDNDLECHELISN